MGRKRDDPLDTSYRDRRHAKRMNDPEYREAYKRAKFYATHCVECQGPLRDGVCVNYRYCSLGVRDPEMSLPLPSDVSTWTKCFRCGEMWEGEGGCKCPAGPGSVLSQPAAARCACSPNCWDVGGTPLPSCPRVSETWPCCGALRTPGNHAEGCSSSDPARRNHESVLAEAARLVDGDRQAAYGHPRDNHGATAEMWRIYIKRRYGIDVPLDAYDVCWLHTFEKGVRDANTRKRDNLTDGCGYLENASRTGDE